MKKLGQKGIAHLGLVLVMLVIAAIIGVGWYVWRNQNKNITNFDECVAAGNPVMESYPEQCAANGQTFVNERQKNAQDAEKIETSEKTSAYLEIPELGIKMKLDEDTEDAYYVVKNGYVYLSLKSLKEVDDCAADKTSLAAASKVKKTDTNEMTGTTYEEEAKSGNGTLIGEYVYVVTRAQASCTEQAGLQDKAGAASSAFPKLAIEAL